MSQRCRRHKERRRCSVQILDNFWDKCFGHKVTKFPAVTRDIALLLKAEISHKEVVEAIEAARVSGFAYSNG